MEWDEASGTVSRSFDNWKPVDQDIRAFFKLTARWAPSKYEEIWTATEQETDIVDF